MKTQLLNTYGAALQLSTTDDQVKQLIASGQLPCVLLPNGQPRVDRADVDAWIRRTKSKR